MQPVRGGSAVSFLFALEVLPPEPNTARIWGYASVLYVVSVALFGV